MCHDSEMQPYKTVDIDVKINSNIPVCSTNTLKIEWWPWQNKYETLFKLLQTTIQSWSWLIYLLMSESFIHRTTTTSYYAPSLCIFLFSNDAKHSIKRFEKVQKQVTQIRSKWTTMSLCCFCFVCLFFCFRFYKYLN